MPAQTLDRVALGDDSGRQILLGSGSGRNRCQTANRSLGPGQIGSRGGETADLAAVSRPDPQRGACSEWPATGQRTAVGTVSRTSRAGTGGSSRAAGVLVTDSAAGAAREFSMRAGGSRATVRQAATEV